jgi:hypothetical protein
VLQAYLAKVSNATTAVGSSASWFKVYETGLVSDKPDYWATEVMNNNCGHVTFTIPSVASGNYLLRPEVIGSSFVTDPAYRKANKRCSAPLRERPGRRTVLHELHPAQCRWLRHGHAGRRFPSGRVQGDRPRRAFSRCAFHTLPVLTVAQILINIYSSLTTYACESVCMPVWATRSCRHSPGPDAFRDGRPDDRHDGGSDNRDLEHRPAAGERSDHAPGGGREERWHGLSMSAHCVLCDICIPLGPSEHHIVSCTMHRVFPFASVCCCKDDNMRTARHAQCMPASLPCRTQSPTLTPPTPAPTTSSLPPH